MKKISVFLLKSLVALVGIGTLFFLLWEPHLEGRNVNATLFEIYFNDPFLVYAYIASIPFFIILYQILKILGYAGENNILSSEIMKALRTIKYSAMSIIGFVVIGEIFIMLSESDDRAGGVFIGFLVTIVSVGITLVATRFERIYDK
jgi:hypothetical protein